MQGARPDIDEGGTSCKHLCMTQIVQKGRQDAQAGAVFVLKAGLILSTGGSVQQFVAHESTITVDDRLTAQKSLRLFRHGRDS